MDKNPNDMMDLDFITAALQWTTNFVHCPQKYKSTESCDIYQKSRYQYQ